MRRLPNSLSQASLKQVWSHSRDANPGKAAAPGIDQVAASTFSANLVGHITNIRFEVANGAYKFSPLRIAVVPKPSGGNRIIAVPTVKDRFLQRALLRHLENDPQFSAGSDVSYGFAKKRTLQDAQKRALELRQQYPWVLQADIVKFFDQIQRSDVKALVTKRVRSKSIAELLNGAVDCELDSSSGSLTAIASASGIVKGRGLRQGMPVSPMLSNLLLKGFDNELTKSGIAAIRYADDIAIFGYTKNECKDHLEKVLGLLASLGLSIPGLGPESKTKILGPTDVLQFLGIEIRKVAEGYAFFPPDKKIIAIKTEMADLCTQLSCTTERRNVGQLVRVLESFVMGHVASMAVLEDGGLFQEKLMQEKQRCLRNLMIEILGQPIVTKLSKNQTAILGLNPFE